MANELTTLLPKILARGLSVLRERCAITQFVNFDYANSAAAKGDVITVPVSSARTSSDVVPGPTPPQAEDSSISKVEVPLDQWKHASFGLTDQEMVNIDKSRDFLPLQAQEAVRSLGNGINQYIWGLYTDVPGIVGTPGTTPFASNTQVAIDARKALHSQLCPRENRAGILDLDAEAAALARPEFSDVDRAGDSSTKREGEIGRKYGFNWLSDDYVPTHTAGDASGRLVNSSSLVIGSRLIPYDGGTGTFNVGDIVTFAGSTHTYAVSKVEATQITLSTGLKAVPADNAAITVTPDHVVNMAFHRDAFAFVMRPLLAATQAESLGHRMVSMQDPKTGLVMRLEVSRQFKQTAFDFDVLYGGKIVRPPYAVRIAG